MRIATFATRGDERRERSAREDRSSDALRVPYFIRARQANGRPRRSGHPTRYRRALHSAYDPFVGGHVAAWGARARRRVAIAENSARRRNDEGTPRGSPVREYTRTRVCITVTLGASSRPLASLAPRDHLYLSALSLSLSPLGGPTPVFVYLSVGRTVSSAALRIRARARETDRERKKERARETRSSERARCNGTSVTQSWEDYGIETPGGKAQCQSALHFVPVSTESVTRDVVFAAFPRKVSGGRARRSGRGEKMIGERGKR